MRQEVFNINSMQMENLNEKERVFNYAKELKLTVMRDELDDFITQATDENWSYRAYEGRIPRSSDNSSATMTKIARIIIKLMC